MKEFRHLFLTGEKRVGKSTLLRRALEAAGLHPAGFETKPYTINGRQMGFYLHATGRLPAGFANDPPISVMLTPQRPIPVLEVFDGFGARVLDCARESSRFILMDELGNLERHAFAFQKAIAACLNSEAHVVGVLQKRENDMLESIKNRADTLVYTVTEENRDELVEEIAERLRGWKQSE